MYAFYLAAIILASLFMFSILLYVLPKKLSRFYDNKLKYKLDGRICQFYNSEWQDEELKDKPEILKKLKKNYAKQKCWHTIYLWEDDWKIGLILIAGGLLFIVILISIISPMSASMEIAKWEEFLPMAETAIVNGSDTDNFAITGNIIDYNTWLVEARASLKTFGCWSRYYTNRDIIAALPYLVNMIEPSHIFLYAT